jgi:hypothetical protein
MHLIKALAELISHPSSSEPNAQDIEFKEELINPVNMHAIYNVPIIKLVNPSSINIFNLKQDDRQDPFSKKALLELEPWCHLAEPKWYSSNNIIIRKLPVYNIYNLREDNCFVAFKNRGEKTSIIIKYVKDNEFKVLGLGTSPAVCFNSNTNSLLFQNPLLASNLLLPGVVFQSRKINPSNLRLDDMANQGLWDQFCEEQIISKIIANGLHQVVVPNTSKNIEG